MTQEKVQGGAMGGVEELYREVILDHFKSPKNRGALPNANAKADGTNPLCGDQISISAIIDGETIKDVKFEGHGCAISQSAASMLTQLMKGKTADEIRELANLFKKMLGVSTESSSRQSVSRPSRDVPANDHSGAVRDPGKKLDPGFRRGDDMNFDDLGDLIALEGVKKYPVRIKCALLSANTFLEAINQTRKTS